MQFTTPATDLNSPDCERCGGKLEVTDSRWNQKGRYIRRRRKCQACNTSFTTYEHFDSGVDEAELKRLHFFARRLELLFEELGGE